MTFCHHRWLRDGTQVVVNQAVEHTDVPAVKEDVKGKVCRAQALRGANCRLDGYFVVERMCYSYRRSHTVFRLKLL